MGSSSGSSPPPSIPRPVRTTALGWDLGLLQFRPPYFGNVQQDFPEDFPFSPPLRATVVRNDGGGVCGYLAFGQWLQKYRGMKEAQTQCNALRDIVANFTLPNCFVNGAYSIIDNEFYQDAKARAQAVDAGAGENWMTDIELTMLACHFKICIILYKDYELIPAASRNVTYDEINPLQKLDCDENNTMWLRNSLLSGGSPHYELLIDVEFKTK